MAFVQVSEWMLFQFTALVDSISTKIKLRAPKDFMVLLSLNVYHFVLLKLPKSLLLKMMMKKKDCQAWVNWDVEKKGGRGGESIPFRPAGVTQEYNQLLVQTLAAWSCIHQVKLQNIM